MFRRILLRMLLRQGGLRATPAYDTFFGIPNSEKGIHAHWASNWV